MTDLIQLAAEAMEGALLPRHRDAVAAAVVAAIEPAIREDATRLAYRVFQRPLLSEREAQRKHEAAIRADERARIAAKIRAALVHLDDGSLNAYGMGQEYAARIAEGS